MQGLLRTIDVKIISPIITILLLGKEFNFIVKLKLKCSFLSQLHFSLYIFIQIDILMDKR